MSEFAPIPVSLSSALETQVLTETQSVSCAICRTSLRATRRFLAEPNTIRETPLSWTLCRGCYHAVLAELVYSPVQTAMRLRIAVGVVASQYAAASSRSSESHEKLQNWLKIPGWFLLLAICAQLLLVIMLSVWSR